ncbi:MAG: hypothetical protein KKF44_10275, partial [Nanoarchaeota archaeon]|nr:hypothetical protein [Nanoarchaeota archaeon]
LITTIMKTISSIVEDFLSNNSDESIEKLNKNISSNLEFRLIFNIDFAKDFKSAKREFLKNYFVDLVVMNLGNITKVAESAKIARRHAHRKINELDIDVTDKRKQLLKPEYYIKMNVREVIDTAIEDLKDRADPGYITYLNHNIDELSRLIKENHADPLSYEEAVDIFEREYLKRVIEDSRFDIKMTAKMTGLSPRTIYRKILKLKILDNTMVIE